MFFFMRYPSVAELKIYFADIVFDKKVTSQLVKWFSNFREFYYIQMENFAKQALAEGINSNLHQQLFKQLNHHFNRKNLIQPPDHLQFVVHETLKKFFIAIQSGKNNKSSWKKE